MWTLCSFSLEKFQIIMQIIKTINKIISIDNEANIFLFKLWTINLFIYAENASLKM